MGRPSPDILDGGSRSERGAADVDLNGGRMLDSFLAFRKLVGSEYTQDVNPDTSILMIKDKEGKVVFMHEDGIRLEASYQNLLKAQRERAERERAAVVSKKAAGKQE